jgi:hypothetical protein
MVSEDFSKNGLFAYLRESAKSGVLNPAVARSRKVAAQQLLDHISPEECLNLRLIDVDTLCSRIHKLEDSTIRVEALNLYNARLKSALTDYYSWIDDPEHFVSSSAMSNSTQAQNKLGKIEQKALEDITLINVDVQSGIIPIAIRDDLTVFIKDLPIDLTQAEAQKIVKVVKAYANGEGNE